MTPAKESRPDFFLSRWLFLRLLGVVHLIAFVSLWTQIHGLIGSDGILPAADYLASAQRQVADAMYLLPTLCWIDAGDTMLHVLCAVGVLASVCLIIGMAPIAVLIVLWTCYLSLAVAGQVFLGFQWDTLLLEVTFFAIFFAPWSLRPGLSDESRPSPVGRWLLWWLLFKLMFLSGITKLLSGDETWRALTAMDVHYQTQPIPNRLSWYMHHLPELWHQIEVIAMLGIELAVPFFIFGPRRLRHIACLLFILLQFGIETTGNYGFFNLLTVVLCLPLLDDRLVRRLAPRQWNIRPPVPASVSVQNKWLITARYAPLAVLGFVSFVTCIDEMVRTQNRETLPAAVVSVLDGSNRLLLSWTEPAIASWLGPFRTFNGYGLFRVMTTERPEIVIEGSRDGVTWIAYAFRWKPGDLRRAPATVAPHMPRLDWQMWFAALNPRGSEYWLVALMRHLLDGTPDVLALLDENPFPEGPPQFMRLMYYNYTFTDAETRQRTGNWWQRTPLGALTGPMSREMLLPGGGINEYPAGCMATLRRIW